MRHPCCNCNQYLATIGKRNAAKPAEQHKRQISITLTPEALAKLDALAKAGGTNRSAVVDALIIEK